MDRLAPLHAAEAAYLRQVGWVETEDGWSKDDRTVRTVGHAVNIELHGQEAPHDLLLAYQLYLTTRGWLLEIGVGWRPPTAYQLNRRVYRTARQAVNAERTITGTTQARLRRPAPLCSTPPQHSHCDNFDDGDGDIVLGTCTAQCVRPCKGQCGCRACRMHYADFLSGE